MPEVKRILVVKLSALGDLFHAVPVVHLLASHFQCKVDWVTQPEYMSLIHTHADVDRVISFPRKGGMADSKTFLRQLRLRQYDLALDLQGLTKSGLVLGLCRAKRKIGTSHPRECAKLFAGETPPALAQTPHALDQLLDSCRYLGVPTEPRVYPLAFPEGVTLTRGEGRGEGPLIALAPRSRWPAKDWPENNYIALGQRLIAEKKATVLLIGGADDQELGARMQASLGEQAQNLCGQSPLLGLGALLRQVDVLVCNDSGPMHFAAAVGTPLVALFGPTDPAKTGPVSDRARVLRPDPGSAGYPDPRSYKQRNRDFISKLSVDEVLATVLQQLSETQRDPRTGKADFFIDESARICL